MMADNGLSLSAMPMTLAEANEFVANFHRHNRPVVGARFSVGAGDGVELWGVAIVGRPVARMLQQQGGVSRRWCGAACGTAARKGRVRSSTRRAGEHGERWAGRALSPTRSNQRVARVCAALGGR